MLNRQLKFRVWDRQTKKFSYFGIRDTMGHLPTDIPDENIQQFTGLTDYAGDEIYEGDILQEETTNNSPKNTGVCKSVPGGWRIFSLQGFCFHAWSGLVIGNIFENPELLDTAEDE